MYKRYVDDINIVTTVPERGARFENGVLTIVESAKDEDRKRSPDERCMSLLRTIGNSIHPSIEIEVDYPSNHCDCKLPILDLKVWIERRDEESSQASVILHEFYCKDVVFKSVLDSRSALPWQSKQTILTQQVLRVLLNCSNKLPWERTIEHVNLMVLRIQYSGYEKKFRFEVVRSTLNAYRKEDTSVGSNRGKADV